MASNPSTTVVAPDENGIAVQVKADYIPKPEEKAQGILTLTQGELGWAFNSSFRAQQGGWIICQIGIGRAEDQKVGWVCVKYLNKGKERVRPLPIDMRQPVVQAPNATLPGNSSCLEKTVHGLWRAIQANRNTIETELSLSPEISAKLFGPNTSHYPNEIMRAFTPEARTLMASGNFHPRHFAQLTAMSKTSYPQKSGVYVRVYPGIESPAYFIFRHRQKPPTTGFYVGQTIGSQWPFRFESHEKDMAGSTRQHYRLARTCDTENVSIIPIILFDEQQPMVKVLTLASCLSAAELTMVCLCKSWFPVLLGPNPLSAVAAYILDFRSAKIFTNIMNNVKLHTGWNPMEIVGCNWQTPVIRDMDRELTWCSWFDYEKQMKVFRCCRRLFIELKKKSNSPDSARINLVPNQDLFIPLEILKQSSLKNGQSVHVVVEFMNNNMDHPSMFVRFPRIGPNRELEMLRSMAIRLEWTDESGQWFTANLTRAKVWRYIDDDATKIPAIYQLAMKVARILQCTYYTGAPDWFTSVGRVVVKNFIYDHLKQEIVVVNAQSQTKQWPVDNTIQQNAGRIQALVNSKGWPTVVGVRPANMQHGRVACDICVSQASTTPCFGGKCDFDPATRTCSACASLRRPCTFTDDPHPVEKLQTGAVYSELGMTTNVYYMTNEASVQRIDAPFDPSLDG